MRSLRKFLSHHRLSETQFAQWLGCDRSLVSRWVNGAAIPAPDKMRAIYRLTRGQVQPNDFYDLPRLRQQAVALDDDDIVLTAAAK